MAEMSYQDQTTNRDEDLLVQRFVTGLNILRTNISLYPPGHSTIRQSGEALSESIADLFVRFSNITINAIKSNLLINGILVDVKHVPTQNLALYISRLGIASLNLSRDLCSEDLEHFFGLTQAIPRKKQICDYHDILVKINSLDNIVVQEIDLSSVRFIDEDVVNGMPRKEPVTIWQKMMLSCLSPDLQNAQDADILKVVKIYGRESFSSFVRTFNIPQERLVQGYNTILRNHFHQATGDEDTILEKQEFFKSIQKTFNKAEPILKEQILLTTFDAINNSRDEKTIEEFLDCLPGEMVVEVLTQAVLNKRVLAPALIKLLSILYRAGKDYPLESKTERHGVIDNPIWKRIEELFSKAGYEKYLTQEYAEQLQNLSLDVNRHRSGAASRFASEKYDNTFKERSINRHLTTALLFIMQGNIEEQVYTDYAENIARIIPELLEDEDYKHLHIIYKVLLRHLDARKGNLVESAVLKTLDLYAEDSFTVKLAEAYSEKGESERADLENLIMLNADKNLPWLISRYLEQSKFDNTSKVFDLLCRFGPKAAEAALNKLADSSREDTFALLKLIRGSAGKRSCPQIHNLLKSNDQQIHLEALKTMLHLADPEAIPALQKLVRTKDNVTTLKAFQLVHDYKVQELVPELASQIRTFYISEAALNRNKAVLALLDNLGSSEALPILKSKAEARITLTPGNLKQTKEYLYASLTGYSRPAIGDFIRKGLKSRNRNIRAISERLKNFLQE